MSVESSAGGVEEELTPRDMDVTEEFLSAYFADDAEKRFEFDNYLRGLIKDPKTSRAIINVDWRDEWNIPNSPANYLPIKLKSYIDRYTRKISITLRFANQEQYQAAGKFTESLDNVTSSGVKEIGS